MKRTRFSQAQLANLAEHMGKNGSSPLPIRPIARKASDEHFPLSFAQQRLWFLDQLQSGSPAYNIPVAYQIKGKLDVAVLEQSVNEIIRRHEVLRSVIKTRDGQPVQAILPELTLQLSVKNLEQIPLAQRTEEMHRLVTAEAQEPFNLAEGPMVRVRLFQLDEQEHVLLLTIHHIVFDGWSIRLLSQELTTLYAAFVQGKPSPLPELPVQYADFSHWQRERLQGEVLQTELDYWKQQLAGAPPVLELPTDRPRPVLQSWQGDLHPFTVSQAISHGLEDISRQEGCTLFQTLLAAFQVLLYRYTGQRDIIVGTPIANRGHVETEKLLGFFVNTLVLRCRLSDDPSFCDLLSQVREMTLDAYTHQDIPFEKLVDELQPQRDLSYTPLVQVLFSLQKAADTSLKSAHLTMYPLSINNKTTKFDFSLELIETENGLTGNIQYSVDLFDATTVARLARHFQTLLEAIVMTPSRRISELQFQTAAELQQILQEWNPPASEPAEPLALHQLFEAQARRSPQLPALVYEDQSLSYQELLLRSTRLAHLLRQQGVGPESLVGLCLQRSFELVIGLLAILQAGAVCVPLDPDYPGARLAFLMQDAQLCLLLTHSHLNERLPDHDIPLLCLDLPQESAELPAELPTLPPVLAEQAAYVIYTSGSTGTPKGVLLRHSSLVNRIRWGQQVHPLTPADRVLQEASFSFDFALWEFFGPLSAGAQVILPRPGGQRDIDYLLSLIARHQITVLHLIPSLLRVFLEQPDLSSCASVRHVYAGAEPLPFELWQRYRQRFSAPLHNVYGPTETTIDATCWSATVDSGEQRVLIGRPLSQVEVYLLDASGQPVPIGVPGEIYLGGAGLARGYLHRPELTAERFVPHPFSRQPGARLYRTGDLARYLPDGRLEYVGRVDNQVKVRGFRIELGEVENALSQHPAVAQAVALVNEDHLGERRLVAYVVPRAGEVVLAGELRQFLQERLPDYLLPTRFLSLAHLPLTPHGKLDRQALPEPDAGRPDLKKFYVAPRTPAEELLASIWSQVLGITSIGIHDNFFDLGGDSIRSIQIVARAQMSGLRFSVQQLFRHQTIAELVEAIGQAGETLELLPRTKLFDLISAEDRAKLPADIEDAYPLAMLQTGMIYHMEMTKDLPGAPDYHNPESYYYRMPFNLAAFQQAVDSAVQRHPVLRTSFDFTSFSEPLQLVHKTAPFIVEADDIRQYTPIEQEQIIKQFVEREANTRFDMSHPPLLRFHIHRRTDDAFQFSLTEFHPIIDGWSLHSILTEIFSYYLALLQKRDKREEEPLETSFRDFVALEKMALQSQACQHYWEQKLADANRLTLPQLTETTPQPGDQRYSKIEILVPLELCETLRQLARSANVPLKTLLFAAHVKVMSMLSGQTDILTGQLSHGRLEVMGGDRVAGLFLNILPLRLALTSGSWLDLVHQAFDAECELLPFRRYPLAEMQRRWGGRTPLLNTVFSYFDF
ncbi:MAG TPA: amino acid adenylation domain-containing protein, partial [Ktedonobacteraceae bacterium]